MTQVEALDKKGGSCSVAEFEKWSRRMDKVLKQFQVCRNMLRRYKLLARAKAKAHAKLLARARGKARAKKKLNRQSKVRPQ